MPSYIQNIHKVPRLSVPSGFSDCACAVVLPMVAHFLASFILNSPNSFFTHSPCMRAIKSASSRMLFTSQPVALNFPPIDLAVNLLIYTPHNRHGVATDNVKTQGDFFTGNFFVCWPYNA